MSGGHFDYKQYHIEDIIDKINNLISKNEYPPEVINKFKISVDTLSQASKMAQRIDWLVSCDDSEESFLSRWKEEDLPT